MESLYELHDHFQSYIKDFSLNVVSGQCSVSYTPLAYDFIDSDLDFDEEFYDKMMKNFDKFLESYIRDLIAKRTVAKAVIRKSKMLFRHESVLEYEKEFVRSKNMCLITQKTIEQMDESQY